MHARLRFALAALSIALAAAAPMRAQRRLLFDPRVPRPQSAATRAEIAVLEREARPAADSAFRGEHSCRGQIQVLDVAAGAFTRPGASQRAILYEWCRPARAIGFGGVVVVERGRVVAHVVHGGTFHTLVRVADATGDARDDLLLLDGFMSQGHQEDDVTLLSLWPRDARSFTLPTRSDDCGRIEPREHATVWVTYVVPGATPRFYQQQYAAGCREGARYLRRGMLVPARSVATARFDRLR